jgi:hypothetical protein
VSHARRDVLQTRESSIPAQLVPCDQDDARTNFGERFRGNLADPGRGARYDNGSAVHVSHSSGFPVSNDLAGLIALVDALLGNLWLGRSHATPLNDSIFERRPMFALGQQATLHV